MPTQDKDKFPAASEVEFAELFHNVAVNGGIISSAPAIGGGIGVFDGIDDAITYFSNRYVKSLSFDLFVESASEEVMALSASHSVSVVAGTLTPAGMAAPSTFINGVATTAMPTGAWRRITISTATKFKADAITLAKVGAGFGAIRLKNVSFSSEERNLQEAFDDFNNSTFSKLHHPALYLPFDDMLSDGGTGFYTTDKSGNGYNATLGDGVSAATFPTKLVGRSGYSFDGGDWFQLSSPLLNFTNDFSLVTWCSIPVLINSKILFARGVYPVSGFYFYYMQDGRVLFEIWNAGVQNTVAPAGSIISGATVMASVTSKVGGNNIIYIGDKPKASLARTLNPLSNNELFYIGRYFFGGTWVGNNYKSMAFSFNLTPTQIRDIYNQGSSYNG